MGRYKKRYNKNYRRSGFTKKQQEAAFWSIATVVIIWLFLWLLFWIGVGLLVIGILYLVHFLNKTFNWYDTKYFFAPILSFLVAFSIIAFGGSQILFNLGKIDKTFLDLAVESTNFVKVKYSKGHIEAKPNIEGIVEKSLTK